MSKLKLIDLFLIAFVVSHTVFYLFQCFNCSKNFFGRQGFDESIRLEMRLLGKTGVKTTVVCPFYIHTGMFEGAKSRYPIILPLLQPEYAVKKILQAIRCNQSVLKMPMSTHLLPVMRALLPTPLFDEFCDWTGSLESMDDFKGRAKKTT